MGRTQTYFGLRHDFEVPQNVDSAVYRDDQYVGELKTARQLVESGASRDAISSLLSVGGRHSVSKNHALAIAVICQKYGFIAPAFKLLGLTELTTDPNDDELFRIRAQVVRVKLFMQIGNFGAARDILVQLMEKSTALSSIEQLGAMHRRSAVLFGCTDQRIDMQKAVACARSARTDEPLTKAEITKCDLFEEIARYAHGDFNDWDECKKGSERLSNIRNSFFVNSGATVGWAQLGAIKGAVAALLLETGMALGAADGRNNYRSRILLALVHMLGKRLGGNECAETFGEIIQLTKNPHLRDLMQFALRQDDAGRRAFLEWCDYADIDSSRLAERCMLFLQTQNADKEEELTSIITSPRSIG